MHTTRILSLHDLSALDVGQESWLVGRSPTALGHAHIASNGVVFIPANNIPVQSINQS